MQSWSTLTHTFVRPSPGCIFPAISKSLGVFGSTSPTLILLIKWLLIVYKIYIKPFGKVAKLEVTGLSSFTSGCMGVCLPKPEFQMKVPGNFPSTTCTNVSGLERIDLY